MVTLIERKIASLEEFLQTPETKPAQEFFDNKITTKPMPQGKHSIIQAELTTTLNSFLKPKKIGFAFPELRCTFGGKSIVPDIVVLTYEHIPKDENGDIANIVSSAPDWMIEILSPAQSQSLIIKKILHCLDSGCELAWIIDGEQKTIFAYSPEKVKAFDSDSDVLPVPNFMSDFQLTLGDIFGWLNF
ncbi:MAG: Uma2 family endonuclease [Cyanobacterium sp. T60_A2020_053]|nr:Uma2 family endonuclease [Cyanobacterium sp. T60_A2020_053]